MVRADGSVQFTLTQTFGSDFGSVRADSFLNEGISFWTIFGLHFILPFLLYSIVFTGFYQRKITLELFVSVEQRQDLQG